MDSLMLHRRLFAITSLFLFLTASCVQTQQFSPGSFPFIVTKTPSAHPVIVNTQVIFIDNTSTFIPPTLTSEAIVTVQPSFTPAIILPSPSNPSTSTPNPTITTIPFFGTPVETQLPELELPTLPVNGPSRMSWTGLPTYPVETDGNFLFRVDYDPASWAQTRGNFGGNVLASRVIPFCVITPINNNELPVAWKVDHQTRILGSTVFDVHTAILQDAAQFVTFIGGDGNILTSFQVTFKGNGQECLNQSEIVIASLRSFASIPTPTPSAAPIPKILLSTLTPTP